jgi:tetratricopeptide (TPR) repeat protein
MYKRLFKLITVAAVIAVWGLNAAWAQSAHHTLTITIPRHSHLTNVQRLNREGVAAVQKHNFGKAADLFYKAYLYDPADPFTLNNLGYISELQGRLEEAGKFYKLAAEQGSTANIDLSSVKRLEGKPMNTAFADLKETPMRVNRMNVDAMRLLSEKRGDEAAALLEQARSLDPQNPYTLNNLGVAEESMGDYESALKHYAAAAATKSNDTIELSQNPVWRGKFVSEMAEANGKLLQSRMNAADSTTSVADMLNLRGVSAENQSDWATARRDFLQAYSLNPTSAFSLNNRAYVAERDGDLESAQFFYQKAQKAAGADIHVGRATSSAAVGRPLFQVATESDKKVDGAVEVYSRERHMEQSPVELTPRDNTTPEQKTPPLNQRPVPPSSKAPQAPFLPHPEHHALPN